MSANPPFYGIESVLDAAIGPKDQRSNSSISLVSRLDQLVQPLINFEWQTSDATLPVVIGKDLEGYLTELSKVNIMATKKTSLSEQPVTLKVFAGVLSSLIIVALTIFGLLFNALNDNVVAVQTSAQENTKELRSDLRNLTDVMNADAVTMDKEVVKISTQLAVTNTKLTYLTKTKRR